MNFAYTENSIRSRKASYELSSEMSQEISERISSPGNVKPSDIDNVKSPDKRIELQEDRGTGISEKHAAWQGSGNLGFKGIHGCHTCGGSGYKSSTDKFGKQKICQSCYEIMNNNFLIRNRGMDGCKYCDGDGFVKCGHDSVKACSSCLAITGYCASCLDTGFTFGSSVKCDHRKT